MNRRFVIEQPNNSKETKDLWNEFARQEKISDDWEKYKESHRAKPFKIYPEWKFLGGFFVLMFFVWLACAMKDGVI